MTQYEIRFKTSAAREFRKLSPEVKLRIREAVNALKSEPRPPGAKKLAGETHLYRIRVGDYRIIYEVDDSIRMLQVMRVRHRRDAYQ
ncbi:MAG: type II toxin-antitoxin system RelE/ParE family toxin [Leptolyngbyaceae cyanobacterium RM2_2_4]|nr:type II toxin-antitoxin system RelE/ParE family toxin [Leptolyngbyaceae cyanobacterium SL_5_14]NJO51879.1 type II toxin-antitoxin system RelE/ParE family toxin [Leptolyngbyaceae cyanobacterium RM2_2_4]